VTRAASQVSLVSNTQELDLGSPEIGYKNAFLFVAKSTGNLPDSGNGYKNPAEVATKLGPNSAFLRIEFYS
jgi:hypothetical protein